MPAIRINTETAFTGAEDLPDERQIERAEQVNVSDEDPPMITMEREQYRAMPKLIDAVNLAITLGRPLLLQGDPGCGKTRLAYAIAYELGLPLEICHIKSTSRAQDFLYTYDAVSRLYDAQLGENAPTDHSGEPQARSANNYIRYGPLGRAIIRAQYGRASVVLLDEIDKADLDFPNDLLWELDRLEFQVTEAPELAFAAGENTTARPIIIVTHNEEKALPTAFLRRCIFHYVDFPSDLTVLEEILALHHIRDETLRPKAIDVVLRLRQMDLQKKPGLSELIDWVGYLEVVNISPEELDQLPYIGALLKQREDQQRAQAEMVTSTS